MTHTVPISQSKVVKLTERFIFNVKWILPLFYMGLVGVLLLYGYSFAKEIIHIFFEASNKNMDDMKVIVLDIIDVTMIANLIKMIITGSYNSFISKDHGYPNENISSGMLKIKISTSIIVVSSIHLLKSFISPNVDWDVIFKQLDIYGAFLVSALVLGVLEFIHVKSEVLEHTLELSNHESKETASH